MVKPGGGRKIVKGETGEPISETVTPVFEAHRDRFLSAARHGAVIVSPCISDGEREIARLVFNTGGAVVTLRI